MGTLISEEWLYNSEAATKTFRRSFQSLSGFGSEVEGMANQTYKAQDGVYEYSGEDVYYYAGFSGGGPSGGGGGGTGPDSILLTVSAAASTEPIEAHPRFDGLLTNSGWDTWNRWKANPEDPKNFGVGLTNAQGYFDPSLYTATDAYGVLYVLYMRGIREYYEPKVVVRQTRFEAGAPTLSAVGKIDSPPINPAGSGMTNYILNSADGRYNASNAVWENVYEWVGSRKGWDVNLYGAGT